MDKRAFHSTILFRPARPIRIINSSVSKWFSSRKRCGGSCLGSAPSPLPPRLGRGPLLARRRRIPVGFNSKLRAAAHCRCGALWPDGPARLRTPAKPSRFGRTAISTIQNMRKWRLFFEYSAWPKSVPGRRAAPGAAAAAGRRQRRASQNQGPILSHDAHMRAPRTRRLWAVWHTLAPDAHLVCAPAGQRKVGRAGHGGIAPRGRQMLALPSRQTV